MVKHLTHDDVLRAAQAISRLIPVGSRIFGVPRGGVPVAYLLAGMVEHGRVALCLEDADVVVDDIGDSGTTRQKYRAFPFYALFGKPQFQGTVGEIIKSDTWLVFPWEQTVEGSAEDICTRLLQFIGEDPSREGLAETPRRFLKAWKHFTSGYGMNPADVLKVFQDGAEGVQEMVLVKDIPLFSSCEHHMVPIVGMAHVAYIPNGKIIGLSKIPRLVEIFARRLQVQERLTNQIADALIEHLQPKGVAVLVEARHLCMEARGVERIGTSTTTSALRGCFMDEPAARAEFFSMVKK